VRKRSGQRVAQRADGQTTYIQDDQLTSATNTTGSQATGRQRDDPYGEKRGSTTVVTMPSTDLSSQTKIH
jgi:hypothetical protein